MAVFTLTGEWVIETCCNKSCGVQFALPRGVYDECQRHGEGRPFYCPNGHRQWYREDAATRLRRQLEAEQRAHAQAKEEAERQREMRRKEERRVTAYRGQLTRVKNRVKNGALRAMAYRGEEIVGK